MTRATENGRPTASNRAAAIVLVVWGVIHVAGGVALLGADVVDGLDTLAPSAATPVPAEPGDAAEALLRFHALNIALAGVASVAAVVAAWRTRHRSYLLGSLGIAVAFDIGLLAFLVGPGLLPPAQGLIGPVLAALAALFIVRDRTAPTAS